MSDSIYYCFIVWSHCSLNYGAISKTSTPKSLKNISMNLCFDPLHPVLIVLPEIHAEYLYFISLICTPPPLLFFALLTRTSIEFYYTKNHFIFFLRKIKWKKEEIK